jgi:N-acetylglucosaminyl-diphospho-decaprenol L-rhamnosyltransferase
VAERGKKIVDRPPLIAETPAVPAPPPRVREITAIVVSWQDAEETEAAVASLAAARRRVPPGGPKTSLVVVENGGPVRRGALLALWPDARLISNDENRGFGPAANQAAAAATGDVLLFLNPDTRAEGDPFSVLAEAFDADASVLAVAPRLLDVGGAAPESQRAAALAPPGREDQFTFQLRRLPSLAADARELLLIDHVFPNNAARRRVRYADSDRDAPLAVEQAAGAAIAVRASVFGALGGFDERYVPAWFEDVDLCARLVRRGGILYLPQARFRHRGGASSIRMGYASFLPVYYRNALRYRRQHYGLLSRAIYRALLGAGMLLRLGALPLRRQMPRPRGEAARAYLAVLRLVLTGRVPPPDSEPLTRRVS